MPGFIAKYICTCETTLSITPPESPEAPRAGARESSSSKKITHGRADLACKAMCSIITCELKKMYQNLSRIKKKYIKYKRIRKKY
jgi:hypothetical protein